MLQRVNVKEWRIQANGDLAAQSHSKSQLNSGIQQISHVGM